MAIEGYQAWEVLLKLAEPDLKTALKIAKIQNLDMETLVELLSVGVFAMKQGLNDSNSEKTFNKTWGGGRR